MYESRVLGLWRRNWQEEKMRKNIKTVPCACPPTKNPSYSIPVANKNAETQPVYSFWTFGKTWRYFKNRGLLLHSSKPSHSPILSSQAQLASDLVHHGSLHFVKRARVQQLFLSTLDELIELISDFFHTWRVQKKPTDESREMSGQPTPYPCHQSIVHL